MKYTVDHALPKFVVTTTDRWTVLIGAWTQIDIRHHGLDGLGYGEIGVFTAVWMWWMIAAWV